MRIDFINLIVFVIILCKNNIIYIMPIYNQAKSLLERAKEIEQEIKNDAKRTLINKGKRTVSKGKTLLDIGKEKKTEAKTLLDIGKEEKLEKPTMLEERIETDFLKLYKRKKHIPARFVEEKNYQVEEKDEKEFPVAKASKIVYYAEKYRIPFNKFGFKKTFKELSKDIQEYEKKNFKRILSYGEDNKYDEYGMYIRRI